MKNWHLVLLLVAVVITALLIQREFLVSTEYDDPYKERYEQAQDSLKELRTQYAIEISKQKVSIDSLEIVIDSLHKQFISISKDYDLIRDRIEELSQKEVKQEFDSITHVEEPANTDSVIVSTGQLRKSLTLFSERNLFEDQNKILLKQIDEYKTLTWTYKEMARLSDKQVINLEESLTKSDFYIDDLQTALDQKNVKIKQLNRKNNLIIGGAVVSVAAVIIIAL